MAKLSQDEFLKGGTFKSVTPDSFLRGGGFQKEGDTPEEKKGFFQKVSDSKPVQALSSFATGVAKGGLDIAEGVSSLVMKPAAKGFEAVTGSDVLVKAQERGAGINLEAENTAESAGKLAVDVASFALPQRRVTSAGLGVKNFFTNLAKNPGVQSVLRKVGIGGQAVTEGVAYGGVEFLKEGELNDQVKSTAITGGAFVPAAEVLKSVGKPVLQSLNNFLIGQKGTEILGMVNTNKYLNQYWKGDRTIAQTSDDVEMAIDKFGEISKTKFDQAERILKIVPVEQADVIKAFDDVGDSVGGAYSVNSGFSKDFLELQNRQSKNAARLFDERLDKIISTDNITTREILDTRRWARTVLDGLPNTDQNLPIRKAYYALYSNMNKILAEKDEVFSKASATAADEIKLKQLFEFNVEGSAVRNVEATENKLNALVSNYFSPERKARTMDLIRQLDKTTGSEIEEQIQAIAAAKVLNDVAGAESFMRGIRDRFTSMAATLKQNEVKQAINAHLKANPELEEEVVTFMAERPYLIHALGLTQSEDVADVILSLMGTEEE